MDHFEEVYKNNLDSVFRYALKCSGDRGRATDLTADAFRSLHGQLAQITPAKRPTWLFAVVKNRAVQDWTRRAIADSSACPPREAVLAASAGALPPAAQKRVVAHTAGCTTCRTMVRDLERPDVAAPGEAERSRINKHLADLLPPPARVPFWRRWFRRGK
jgi:DNA-directed RNA polymerase specialized sigma24 family protein